MPENKPKRAYRYEVIAHGGEGTKAIGEAPYILDWKNYGREYTWTIFDLKKGEVTGFITGRKLDRGYVVDGSYKTDAEMAAA